MVVKKKSVIKKAVKKAAAGLKRKAPAKKKIVSQKVAKKKTVVKKAVPSLKKKAKLKKKTSPRKAVKKKAAVKKRKAGAVDLSRRLPSMGVHYTYPDSRLTYEQIDVPPEER